MDYNVKEFCKLISEFALEYKTVRDRLLQQQEKRANHRERHKTRGKMITEVNKIDIKKEKNKQN
jgi:FH1/FH2 domain-containing protein 3